MSVGLVHVKFVSWLKNRRLQGGYAASDVIVAKGLSVVYDVDSPTRRIMENEGLFTKMQENTLHRPPSQGQSVAPRAPKIIRRLKVDQYDRWCNDHPCLFSEQTPRGFESASLASPRTGLCLRLD
ncbi:hypothetical protein AVEN_230318-1 [Araneus ventricosus]|uniref:Uncharacterized protein n=1 Tax=Araneus ventricosus TaxID=182803 RepID=A0A4Y2R7N9_ARAVE|nr:hypothetical protein AVEN_176709-1 [Araneus ventricosus]GBN71446.1 hypothetical protein AVEN_230318-1 [Araneus ventricosus]